MGAERVDGPLVEPLEGSPDGPLPAGEQRLQRRAEQRRLEILRAAARVFRRRGYAATGMREIAAEADLSPGNLYYYFSGKDELLFFCQDRALNRLLSGLNETVLKFRTASARIEHLLRHHVETLLDTFDGGMAHLELDALAPARRDEIMTKRDRYELGLRGLIRDGVDAGEFTPCDPALVARAILGAVNWPALWFRPDGGESAAGVAAALSEYLLRGLLDQPDGTTSRPPRSDASDERGAAEFRPTEENAP